MSGFKIKECIMELVGTFALCYVGGLSIQFGGHHGQSVPALAHGIVLGTMIYAGAHISGAHYNPAVTIGLCCVKQCEWLVGQCYIAFQLVGSILAGALLFMYTETGKTDPTKRCFCPGVNIKESFKWRAFLLEMIATWFLMFTIMGTAVEKKAPKGVFGFAIGGMLTACIYSVGNLTGGALNPARMIGPSIGSGDIAHKKFWGDSWVYLLAPICGAVIAAFMWILLFADNSAKDDDDETELVVERDFETGLVELEVGAHAPIVNNSGRALPVPVPVIAPVSNVKWSGFYAQNDDKFDMEQKNMVLDHDGNVAGEGNDNNGSFTIEGIMANGVLQFKKQYSDYFVNYSGTQRSGETKFVGNWEIPNECNGEFEIECVIPQWKGYYKQDGETHEMQLSLSVSNDGVYGHGTDKVGFFVCRGQFKNGKVNFRKQYIGQHYLDYAGEYRDSGRNRANVKGRWALEGDGDKFELNME